MRKLGVFTAVALSGILVSCAERVVSSAGISKPAPEAAPQPRPNKVVPGRQAGRIAERNTNHLAARPRQANPSAGVKPEQLPIPQAPLAQTSQQPQEPPIGREPPMSTVLPPPEPDKSNFLFEALMPPPADPAEPILPSAPTVSETPPLSEPAEPILPEVSAEVEMPLPPEPAEPSFPVATSMPPPPEPAEPSLPSQEEIVAESSIPFPELSAPLSMQPHFDWEEVTGSLDIPRSPLAEAFEATSERQVPSITRNPWPLPVDAP